MDKSLRNATTSDLQMVLELLEAVKLPTAGVKDQIQNFKLEFEHSSPELFPTRARHSKNPAFAGSGPCLYSCGRG